ncbi:hypothetical protein [Polyangium spumosum]|uniref:Uncharacterized protein n=1 Tax=Polyangium spumosum TaxID=889282 RepID=A0A6N7Q3F5_9BACT|nr:hypothetical protein [Polyangium spumosum]MRG98559.1 hypothetical protein [Polyangium spumosum]
MSRSASAARELAEDTPRRREHEAGVEPRAMAHPSGPHDAPGKVEERYRAARPPTPP